MDYTMKRKVLCNNTTCALDVIPEMQYGGGLSVRSPNYITPLETLIEPKSIKKGVVGRGQKPEKRLAKKPNKVTCQKQKLLSTKKQTGKYTSK